MAAPFLRKNENQDLKKYVVVHWAYYSTGTGSRKAKEYLILCQVVWAALLPLPNISKMLYLRGFLAICPGIHPGIDVGTLPARMCQDVPVAVPISCPHWKSKRSFRALRSSLSSSSWAYTSIIIFVSVWPMSWAAFFMLIPE